ncbi:amino acid transporter [Komagataeibacter intermedius AF2]|uniref:Amino acid transporter n=1 Tax=Komagataeibacter intermedius AF2 TaxID=1458464 RepID=A0A0N0MDL4_9PROT|nr:cytosine permease [Komagataeibacter intermedius]KPH85406.1 amino acid transporter [Komagataeibacter intermedius AF2]
MSNKSKRFPPEFRERAARMVLEEEKNHPSRWSGAVIMTPWNLYARPELIHLTLDVLATFIGPLIAILLTDYYIVRRGVIDVSALYRSQSNLPYWYHNGINPVAILVMVIAVIVGSAVVFMPALEPIHNLSLFIGGGIAALLYGIIMRRHSYRLTTFPSS